MAFWDGEIDSGGKVASLNLARDVAHRRADNAQQCECLAAWDDDRECICNKTVELPLSLAKLSLAEKIAGKLRDVEGRIAALEDLPGPDIACQGRRNAEIVGWSGDSDYRRMVHYSDGSQGPGISVEFRLPKKVALAALKSERLGLLDELQQTGIISVDRPNIKAVPK